MLYYICFSDNKEVTKTKQNKPIKDGDLHDLIEKKRADEDFFHEETIYKWTLEMINALVYLHDRSTPIVHKDIKPA